jgi:hypothetical protein
MDRNDWSAKELDAVVSTYMEMLQAESRGVPYVKAQHNREVQQATGRSKGSVEFKFCNISAVLVELGYPFIAGYQPRGNYQAALKKAIEAFLEDNETAS